MKIPALLLALFIAGCTNSELPDNSAAPAKKLQVEDVKTQTQKSKVAKPTVPTSDPIAFIRKEVEQTNTSELRNVHFEFECDVLMKVDYFYDGDELRKISVDFGFLGDSYAKEDYYYDKGSLIFKYEFVEGGPACEGCIETNEYRSYIKNNKVFRYLKNKSEAECNTCRFHSSSKEYRLFRTTDPAVIKAIFCS